MSNGTACDNGFVLAPPVFVVLSKVCLFFFPRNKDLCACTTIYGCFNGVSFCYATRLLCGLIIV